MFSHVEPPPDPMKDRRLLDLDGARTELAALGLEVSRFQIARWASERVLPFFLVGRRLMIQRAELHFAIQKRQAAAIRGDDRRPRDRRRRRAA